MKYGVLLQKNNLNIGDDIQAYATSQFLPSVDYLIDRESFDSFRTESGEPVAVIMSAWYMWRKWNWPPASCIFPKYVGFHYADHQLAKQPGTPFKYEFLTGLGGEYLKSFAPIGARDMFTKESLEKLGISSYFSGCITLTLPNQPKLKVERPYVCVVDVDANVAEKLKKDYKDSEIELRFRTHTRTTSADQSWEERVKMVEERLTEYQNALCVVTKKLHCSLPCLAMGVPVLLIKQMEDDIRFRPYYDWLHWVKTSDFMTGKGIQYDITNPPANKGLHLETRNKLSEDIKEFIKGVQDGTVTQPVQPYTEEELIKWRHDEMKKGMNTWCSKYREVQVKNKNLKKGNKNVDKLQKEIDRLKEENRQLHSILDTKAVKTALKVRNMVKGDKIQLPDK